MNEYRVSYCSRGSHYSTWVKAYSPLQAVTKLVQACPWDGFLLGQYRKGDPNVQVTLWSAAQPEYEQLSLAI